MQAWLSSWSVTKLVQFCTTKNEATLEENTGYQKVVFLVA